jgi:hypothetical protein
LSVGSLWKLLHSACTQVLIKTMSGHDKVLCTQAVPPALTCTAPRTTARRCRRRRPSSQAGRQPCQPPPVPPRAAAPRPQPQQQPPAGWRHPAAQTRLRSRQCRHPRTRHRHSHLGNRCSQQPELRRRTHIQQHSQQEMCDSWQASHAQHACTHTATALKMYMCCLCAHNAQHNEC